MHRAFTALIPAVVLLASGCMTDSAARPAGVGAAAAGGGATAMLADAAGAPRGTARFETVIGGVKLIVDADGLPAGVHGIHVHAVGKCEAPAFTTAGGHWNPAMKMHGTEAPNGPHGGDLPNMTIGADGKGHYEAMLAGAMLTGGDMPMLDADGAAIVIHAAPDDYRTDPAGNSGARVACGVITAS